MGRISFSGMYTSPSGPVPRHMVEDWVREPTQFAFCGGKCTFMHYVVS